MKLTGKAKERFEKWYSENYYKGSITVHGSKSELMNNFISSPISMQWGVYLEFFDSVEIKINVRDSFKTWRASIETFSDYYDDMRSLTRAQSQQKAIEKANEILNGRL